MTHGTWYSRLTMPMCESGVPDRHTTAASSSKIGARKVAPGVGDARHHALRARVHQLEHVVGRRQAPPRTADRLGREHPGSRPDLGHGDRM